MRKLSIRERVLLLCLALVAAISGYILFFYMPMTQHTEALNMQITQEEDLVAQLEAKIIQQQRMEKMLKQISTQENAPHYMPKYDDLQRVMVELNSILANCLEYSLSFQEDHDKDRVFCRRVAMPFTCTNYQQVHDTLKKILDSPLRSFLTDLEFTQQEDGTVKASAVMSFFEYRDDDLD